MASRGARTKEHILERTKDLVFAKGFGGASIEDILQETGLTKGAFFYHFKSKSELARALIERYATEDFAVFEGFRRRAEELSDDPLQALLISLRLMEEFAEENSSSLQGCLFASYIYESAQFEPEISEFISKSFKRWEALHLKQFKAVLKQHKPTLSVEAETLARMYMCLIEGALVLHRSYDDPKLIAKQIKQFRDFIQLLFRQ